MYFNNSAVLAPSKDPGLTKSSLQMHYIDMDKMKYDLEEEMQSKAAFY